MARSSKSVLNAYEVSYRRDGEDRTKIVGSLRQANLYRRQLIRNKRKFIGIKPVSVSLMA